RAVPARGFRQLVQISASRPPRLRAVDPSVIPRAVECHPRHLHRFAGLLRVHDPAAADVERDVAVTLVVEDEVAWTQRTFADRVRLGPLTTGEVIQGLAGGAPGG